MIDEQIAVVPGLGRVGVSASYSDYRAVLGMQPLAWIGRISYGLYLWHIPVYALFPLALIEGFGSEWRSAANAPWRPSAKRDRACVLDPQPAQSMPVRVAIRTEPDRGLV